MSQPQPPSKSPTKKGTKSPSPPVRTSKARKAAKAEKAEPALPPEAQLVEDDETRGEVLEFATAIDAYKRNQRRPFPTWGEVLEVLKGLGYRRSA
jgi:hypothetical protein